jgi:hypothetical protein
MGNIKIVDNIFYYPGSISDDWIKDDIIRSLFKENAQYNELIKRNDFIIIFAHGIPDRQLKQLVSNHKGKKILFIHCGENIYTSTRLIGKAFALFNKLRIPPGILNYFLFNPISTKALSHQLSSGKESYFNRLVETGSEYAFFLTNELGEQKSNVFFAPYFFFFSRPMMDKIQSMDMDEKIASVKHRKFCAFIVSNPNNIDRIVLYKKLSAYKKIDSYGKLFNNVKEEKKAGEHYMNLLTHNYQIFQQYKFVICFENSYARGYITEKIVNAMAGGAIPIYRGDDKVDRYFNSKSFINYEDYKSIDKMVDAIIAMDQNEDKYLNVAKEPYLHYGKPPEGYENLSLRINTFLKDYLNR